MLEKYFGITPGGQQEKLLTNIAKKFQLEGFTDALLEMAPPDVNPADVGIYKTINQEIRLQGRQMTINAGELVVVRYVENSQILVKNGAKIDIINLKNSQITHEEGGVVRVFESDKVSLIKEIIPERKLVKCSGCGAPYEGRPTCSWCGSSWN